MRTFTERACNLLWLVATLPIWACASLPERLEGHLDRGELQKARWLLDEAGAGESLRDDAPAEARTARDRFTAHVERRYLGGRGHGSGNRLVGVCKDAELGLELAPWSKPLQDRTADCRRRFALLDALGAEWDRPPRSVGEARRALQALEKAGADLHLRPPLLAIESKSKERLVEHWAEKMERDGAFVDEATVATFRSDLHLLGLQRDPCIEGSVDLALGLGAPGGAIRMHANESRILEAAGCLRTVSARRGSEEARKLRQANSRWLRWWFREVLPEAVRREDASFAVIARYEELLERHPAVGNQRLHCAVGELHLALAEERAGAGAAAAALSLHYLHRARDLCRELPTARIDTTRKKAIASLMASGGYGAEIGIDAEPDVDPRAYEIVRVAIMATLRNRSGEGFAWRFLPPARRSGSANIIIEKVELHIPDVEQLNRVPSQYYSHTEEAPNPRRAQLLSLLRSAKYGLDTAESSLEIALTTFQYSPNESTLFILNQARSSYERALNEYNGLVARYNATPATISQPVYLPYVFAEGNVAYGWVVRLRYEFGSTRGRSERQSIDRSYVRIGTRYDDRDPARRRDQELSFEVSLDRTVGHLDRVVSTLVDDLAPQMGALVDLKFTAGLVPEEMQAARWLFHPFETDAAMARSMSIQPWLIQANEGLELPEFESKPPETLLVASAERPPAPLTAASAARWFQGLVGEVITEGPSGRSSASGAIVSGDGLILTCAHGIEGSRISIRFSSGAWAGTYPAEIVFVNEASDTALLRAKGLRTKRWMEVRLDAQAQRGEEVVAIGNPSLAGGSSSIEAITQGIVSNPESLYYGSPRIVADVAIASGSSGGPLVSLRDGKIIGITVAVSRPEFSGSRAATKSFALVAPAHRLGEWLGLESARRPRAGAR